MRTLLRENLFENARSFADLTNQNYDKACLFALEFIHKFKTGQDCLEMINNSVEGNIPT